MPEPRCICNMYGRNISYTHNFDKKTKDETTYGTSLRIILESLGKRHAY
jgi:hypothetical protein